MVELAELLDIIMCISRILLRDVQYYSGM
jgi:hypothetical protein